MRLEDWLDDLCVRFIINLPGDDLSSVERICFQVEEAQWYYEDFIRPLDPSLPTLSLRNFCLRIFAHCPLLSAFSQGDHMAAFEEFLIYKRRIPVRGAIMLNHNMDSVVLVKGWKKGANWSFPRGKINKDEDDLICALREVYEETGYDLEAAGLVPENREVKHITLPIRDQDMSLYVFRDVPLDTYFEPKTRKEISKIQWWRISDLPGFRRKGQQHPEATTSANKFYMVAPFLRDLRKWIIEQKKADSRRVTSNQYLSAAMSHDEFLTEEDLGAESTQEQSYAKSSIPAIDTLEGATAALKSLLKVQPPTQGLQTDAVKSPVVRDSGSELLALLQGKNHATSQASASHAPPQTPLDHTISESTQPKTPHHEQPRPPHFSSLGGPPTFPLQQPSGSFSYQDHNQQRHHQPTNASALQQSQAKAYQQQPSRPQEPPHYQPQHLVHPQPLPPHVQRAVFTGGPVHAPMVPHPVQQEYEPPLRSTVSVTAPNPQFPGLHSPMVPLVQRQSPPKLTSHSLALLNAFKSRDQATGENGASTDLPLRRYAQDVKQALPQELPAEITRPAPVDLLSLFKAKDSPLPASNLTAPSPRPPISEVQRSTLLDLFKSPSTQNAVPLRPAATAFPISATPSAVELSAVEPHSNTVPISAPSNDASNGDSTGETKTIPELNPEANLPFRAMSILSRPPQPSNDMARGSSPPKVEHNGKKQSRGQNHKGQGNKPQQGKKSQPDNKVQTKLPFEKPFQPQILKRPQQGSSKDLQPDNILSAEAVARPLAEKSPSPMPVHQSPQVSNLIPVHPSFDRRSSQTADHKQTLLSLFGKTPSPAIPFSKTSTVDILSPLQSVETPIAAKSRVGSLASGVDGVSRRGSQAPMSPADKSFLLNYLDSVAQGTQH